MTEQMGFKIKEFIRLRNWRVFDALSFGSFVREEICTTCSTKLTLLVALVGLAQKERIDVGCCDTCGKISYIDKPSHDAIRNYYKTSWVQETGLETFIRTLKERYRKWPKDRDGKDKYDYILEQLDIDKRRPVLEVGCGYGDLVHRLQKRGFKHIQGVEPSPTRAKATERMYRIPVWNGSFEDAVFDDTFSFIISKQVLEHTYDPNEIIASYARLQNAGDYVLTSVPNALDEPAMIHLFFLPHLTAFTDTTVRCLFEKHGYEIVDDTLSSDRELFFLARKVCDKGKEYTAKKSQFKEVLERTQFGLGLTQPEERVLVWEKKYNGAYVIPQDLHKKMRKYTRVREVCVESIEKFLTKAPIEIQFDNKVQLLYK